MNSIRGSRHILFVIISLAGLSARCLFGQGFVTVLFDTTFQLTTECDGGTLLGDQDIAFIYWDLDSDGPDIEDPFAPTNLDSLSSCNYDAFALNNAAAGLSAGFFATTTAFASHGVVPIPPLFYLRVCSGSSFWESATFSPDTTKITELEITLWTCFSDSLAPYCATPLPPTDLVVKSDSTNVYLNWSSVPFTHQYRVYVDSQPDGAFPYQIGSTADTSYTMSRVEFELGDAPAYFMVRSVR